MFFKPDMLLAMKYANKADKPAAPAPSPAMDEVKPAPEPKAPAAESAPAPEVSAPETATGSFAAPWEEHAIEFDEAGIKAKGFVRSERASLGGVNGYNFYTADGTCRFIRQEMAVIQKLARKV